MKNTGYNKENSKFPKKLHEIGKKSLTCDYNCVSMNKLSQKGSTAS